jgi:hypothetical protein
MKRVQPTNQLRRSGLFPVVPVVVVVGRRGSSPPPFDGRKKSDGMKRARVCVMTRVLRDFGRSKKGKKELERLAKDEDPDRIG